MSLRFSAPAGELRRRHRRALREARVRLALAVLLPAVGAGLLFCLPPALQHGAEAAQFTAVPYAAPRAAEPMLVERAHRVTLPCEAPAVATVVPPLICRSEIEVPESAELAWEGEAAAAEPTVFSAAEEELWLAAAATPEMAKKQETVREKSPAAAPEPALARRTPPAYRSAPVPPYPAELRARRIAGSVGVRISVSAEGLPTEVAVVEPSGYAAFDTAARRWIMAHWRFHPATADGSAVASHVQTRIDFVLR